MNAKATELSNYETAYAKASETGKGAEDAIKAGKKYQDLYQRYRYHPQEIVANNQMILNNMTSEMESLISKVGPNGAKKELDNLIGYVSGKRYEKSKKISTANIGRPYVPTRRDRDTFSLAIYLVLTFISSGVSHIHQAT